MQDLAYTYLHMALNFVLWSAKHILASEQALLLFLAQTQNTSKFLTSLCLERKKVYKHLRIILSTFKFFALLIHRSKITPTWSLL